MSALFSFFTAVTIVYRHDREKISLEKSMGYRLGSHGRYLLHHEYDHDLSGNW